MSGLHDLQGSLGAGLRQILCALGNLQIVPAKCAVADLEEDRDNDVLEVVRVWVVVESEVDGCVCRIVAGHDAELVAGQ